MAVDMFLKIDGIDGESTANKHKGELELLSFSWGLSQSTSQTGGGGGAGKVSVQDFTVVKQMNNSSPLLMERACTGQHIPSVQLTLASKETKLEYMKIKLTDVLISSYSTGGGGTGGAVPMDQVSFSFRGIDVQAIDHKGQASSIQCDFASKDNVILHNHEK